MEAKRSSCKSFSNNLVRQTLRSQIPKVAPVFLFIVHSQSRGNDPYLVTVIGLELGMLPFFVHLHEKCCRTPIHKT